MPDAILVGTDFSDRSSRAVDHARMLSSTLACPLVVAHAWNPGALAGALFSGAIPVEPLMEAARGSAQAALDALVSECRAAGLDVAAELADGPASRVLVERAQRLDAQMIVVGRRGIAGLAHVLLGSVSERIARTADRPVLVVPSGEDGARPPRRLLVGVDFSGASRDAVSGALRLSKALGCGASPLLVHAYQDERAEWLASWSETGRRLQRRHDPEALRNWVRSHSPEAEQAELLPVEGVVEERLIDVARERDCDWIVLGLQGRTALASFLMGNTTRRVLELTDRPVLVVPGLNAPDREATD